MTKRFLLLLPGLTLLACDSAPAQSGDTDGATETSTASSAGETEDTGPIDPTTGDDPEDPESTTTGQDPTTGADATGDPDTTDGSDTTGGETTTDPRTTGEDDTTGSDETDSGDDTTGSPDPFCGDGNTDRGEVCDDGDDNGSYDACTADCQGQGPSCGDGNTDAPDESCDDGDENGSYDACAADCQGQGPSCGDGNTDAPNEACDDGDDNGSYGSCAANCDGPAAFCGDGNTDAGFEQCDDGDDINGNGCNNDCLPSADILFEITKTTIGTTSSDRGEAIAIRDDGTILAAQRSRLNDDLQQAMVVEFEADGSFVSEHVFANNEPATRSFSVRSLQPSGEYFLFDSPVGAIAETLVSARSPAHDEDWSIVVESNRGLERRPGGGSVGITAPPSESRYFTFLDDAGLLQYESDQNAAFFYSNVLPVDAMSAMFINFVDVGGGLQSTLSRIDDSGAVMTQTIHSDIDIDDWQYAVLDVNAAGQTAVASDSEFTSTDAYVAFFESDGSRAWETTYADPDGGRLHVYDVAMDSAGAVVVVGAVADTTFPFQQDGLVLKFDADGGFLWRRDFAGAADESESLRGVAIAADDSIYVTGSVQNIEDAPDLLLVHLTP